MLILRIFHLEAPAERGRLHNLEGGVTTAICAWKYNPKYF